ncbi:hypothetical protein PRNP1_009173 [Phytophthora ramorum]
MPKRKIRDEGGCELDREVKASYARHSDEKVRCSHPELDENCLFSIPGLRYATESWAGMKTSNEDRYVFSAEFFPGPVFGIFDGHGGTSTADFLTRQLVKTTASAVRQNIGAKAVSDLQRLQVHSGQEKSRKDAIVEQVGLLQQQLAEVEAMNADSTSETSNDTSADELLALADQLTDAISQMNTEMQQIEAEEATRRGERQEWFDEQHNHFLKSFKDAFERVDSQILLKHSSQDGSTALLAWFLADSTGDSGGDANAEAGESSAGGLSFYTVNVGDCRAVICRGGRAVTLTSDHKPDRPDEKQRIERAGGFVGKIAGISRVYSAAGAGLAMQQEASTYLAVSRAFGDRSLKAPTPLVSCEPEVKRFQVQHDDLFLVLACDGIWDVLSEQNVVDIVLPHFHDAKAAADAVVKAAYRKGSVDNLTATVVQFGWKSDVQVQQALENSKGVNSSTPRGRFSVHEAAAQVDNGSEEEIDMFNL